MPRFRSRGRSMPPVPWKYWAKHRNIAGIYVASAITLIIVIVDISLAFTLYKEKVGYFAFLIAEADLVLLTLQVPNFVSTFQKRWLVTGYYCQLCLAILGFLFAMGMRFPISMVIGLSAISSSEGSVNFPAEVIAVGVVMGVLEFLVFMIWNFLTVCSAVDDPEYKKDRMNGLLNLIPTLQGAGVTQVAPRNPAQIEQQAILIEQVRTLQAQVEEMRRVQPVNTTVPFSQDTTHYPIYNPEMPCK